MFRFFIACFTVFFSPFSFATATVIQVNDDEGRPLKDAVVEVIGPSFSSDIPLHDPAIMDQVNKRFKPNLILIKQGQSVLFPNSDNIRHHVYSFSKAKQFELKLYAGRPKDAIPFEQNGVVIVGCNIHDSMIGNIYVAKNLAIITDKDGNATLDIPPTIDQISVWHPHQQINPEERAIFDLSAARIKRSDGHYIISIETEEPPPPKPFGKRRGYGSN